MILGERFGRFPWEVGEADYERAMPYLQALSVEAQIQRMTADLPNDEPLFLE